MQANYEFWANRRIKANQIISAHTSATIERIKEHQTVIAIQDKTEIDLGKRQRTRGIGAIGNQAAKGLHLHTVLAVSESGVPLGLLEAKMWAREKVRKGKGVEERRRKITQKESYRWIESLETSQNLIPPKISLITIADREADIYELFAQPRREGSDLLIRASHNRRVKKAQGETQKLFETLRLVSPGGNLTLELQRTPRRKARKARLTVKFTTVELLAPTGKKEVKSGIKVQAILAEEENPPVGEKAVSWLLLTTLPVLNYTDACDCLEKYAYRWLIERFHYVLKSGCGVEELQLETAERMEKAIFTYAIVAWRLLWLTYEARKNPDKKIDEVDEVLGEKEWKVLYLVTQKNKPLPIESPTLRKVVRQIASLGGFLGRVGDGEPGVKTLWRGWQRLKDMMIGWQLMLNSS